MQKIKVTICTGTSCYVMGSSELLLLKDYLRPGQREAVELEGASCLDLCKNQRCGKSPFVKINGEVFPEASIQMVLERINALLAAGARK
jgi:NADH:ubiquinone oxidoreductase subunit E